MRPPMVTLAPLLVVVTVAMAGCGTERPTPMDPAGVEDPGGTRQLRFSAAGMSFEGPRRWRLERQRSPRVFSLTSGTAIVSGFAYRRTEPLPASTPELRDARDRLVEQIEARDPDYEVVSTATTRVDGARAIDVVGEQTLSGRRLRTRSVHVFRGNAEYVVEALAEPDDFARVDREVLEPLLASAELTGRLRGRR